MYRYTICNVWITVIQVNDFCNPNHYHLFTLHISTLLLLLVVVVTLEFSSVEWLARRVKIDLLVSPRSVKLGWFLLGKPTSLDCRAEKYTSHEQWQQWLQWPISRWFPKIQGGQGGQKSTASRPRPRRLVSDWWHRPRRTWMPMKAIPLGGIHFASDSSVWKTGRKALAVC